MSKDILTEALADVERVKEAAIESAKNTLAEAISPKIKRVIREALNETGEETPETEVDLDEPSTDEVDEAANMPTNLQIPEASEMGLEDEPTDEVEEAANPFAGEETPEEEKAEANEAAEPEKDEKEEVCEISNMAMESAIARLNKESVSHGKLGEVEAAEKRNKDGKNDTPWETQTPPDMEDWTIKEQKLYKIAKSLKLKNTQLENKLNAQNKNARKLVESINDLVLMNTKLSYLNKLTGGVYGKRLSENNRLFIVDKLDRAESLKEAKAIFETIESVLKEGKLMKESRNLRQPASEITTRTSTAKPLNEMANVNRVKELAGLMND